MSVTDIAIMGGVLAGCYLLFRKKPATQQGNGSSNNTPPTVTPQQQQLLNIMEVNPGWLPPRTDTTNWQALYDLWEQNLDTSRPLDFNIPTW